MKNILALCDLYGEHFHWYIGYKPKYYTYYGGIISLISLFSMIFIFIVFGYDDFKRKNPISHIATVPPKEYNNIIFGQKKLYLPWRIINYDEKPINITGIIYPRIYYFTLQPDNKTGELISKYKLINYKLCNETAMKNLGDEYIINRAIDSLYCIDIEDLKVGGSWNSDFLNYIRFDLYMCEDGIDYNDSNYKCTTYEELQNTYGNGDSIFFELLYPVVQFQPSNLDVPILIVYKTLYYIFNKYSNKLDRIYLQEYVFKDEQSLIFNNPTNISYWGVNVINGESYIIGEKDILRYSSTSKLYTLNIYFDLGIIFYTRKYKKLHEILGGIFPIISTVYSFFAFFSRVINELKSAKTLNEYIDGYDLDKAKKNMINKKRIQFAKSLNVLGRFKNKFNCKINIIKTNNTIFKDNLTNKKCNIPNILINKDDSSNLVLNNDINNNIKQPKNGKNMRKNQTIIIKNQRNFMEYLNQNKKEKYPLYFYFCGYLYNRADINKSKKKPYICITDKFYKTFSFYRHLIDITSYIFLYKNYELFKKVICEKLEIDFHSIENDLANEHNNVYFPEDNNEDEKKKNVSL
jgi:hypothetical protein